MNKYKENISVAINETKESKSSIKTEELFMSTISKIILKNEQSLNITLEKIPKEIKTKVFQIVEDVKKENNGSEKQIQELKKEITELREEISIGKQKVTKSLPVDINTSEQELTIKKNRTKEEVLLEELAEKLVDQYVLSWNKAEKDRKSFIIAKIFSDEAISYAQDRIQRDEGFAIGNPDSEWIVSVFREVYLDQIDFEKKFVIQLKKAIQWNEETQEVLQKKVDILMDLLINEGNINDNLISEYQIYLNEINKESLSIVEFIDEYKELSKHLSSKIEGILAGFKADSEARKNAPPVIKIEYPKTPIPTYTPVLYSPTRINCTSRYDGIGAVNTVCY